MGIGSINHPEIRWTHYIGSYETLLEVMPDGAPTRMSIVIDASMPFTAPHTDPRWGLAPPSALIGGTIQPLIHNARENYADIFPEYPGLEKFEFESSFSVPTVDGQWQPCVARCLAWKDGQWIALWETEPMEMLFSPQPLVGDLDADGEMEVAILPWYELLILDARTGAVEDRCKFTRGRSYGFFGAYDLNADGRTEFVVQSDFSKHVDVLGYKNGKLAVLWQREIEMVIDDPQTILRVNPNPVAVLDTANRKGVLINLFNGSGDGTWRLTLHDGITGEAILDLADEYLSGVIDVDGDGIDELLTTRTVGRSIPNRGTIRVLGIQHETAVARWSRKDAAWELWDPPQPPHVNTTATLGNRTAMARRADGQTAVVFRDHRGDGSMQSSLSLASWLGEGFQTKSTIDGNSVKALAFDTDKTVLVAVSSHSAAYADEITASGTVQVVGSRITGVEPSTLCVARERGSKRPIIVAQGHGERIHAFHPPESGESAEPLWSANGRGQSLSWPSVMGPVISDLYGNGERQVLFATSSASGCARLVAADMQSSEIWHHDFRDIPGTVPVWNTGGLLLWQTGHFTSTATRDVLVTVRRSMMHSEETVLLSGEDGRELWRRRRQTLPSQNRGVGGTPFAIADFDGDGLDDIASLHPSLLYILRGTDGENILERDTTWADVPAKPVYWGIPIALSLDRGRPPFLFFSSTRRSMTGLIRADGELAWWDALDESGTHPHAFADLDGNGSVDAVGFGYPGGIRCHDAFTGDILWSLPKPTTDPISGVASADINSDGRDEVLMTAGSTLYCLGYAEDVACGSVLWELDFPCRMGPPALADARGENRLSILLVGGDGNVYCVD